MPSRPIPPYFTFYNWWSVERCFRGLSCLLGSLRLGFCYTLWKALYCEDETDSMLLMAMLFPGFSFGMLKPAPWLYCYRIWVSCACSSSGLLELMLFSS